jgi:hypothetical protein
MRKIHSCPTDNGISIYSSEADEFYSSQEIAATSNTLIKLYDKLKKYYDMQACDPGYNRL